MKLILLLGIFLHIGGCKTKEFGDIIDVAEDTWTEPEDANIRRLLSDINPKITITKTQSPNIMKTTQHQEGTTTPQMTTATSAALPKIKRKEYKVFEKIIRMPVRAPPPTEAQKQEATRANDDQLVTTKKTPPQTVKAQSGTNRSPRQNYYNSNSQKPSFETTRGK